MQPLRQTKYDLKHHHDLEHGLIKNSTSKPFTSSSRTVASTLRTSPVNTNIRIYSSCYGNHLSLYHHFSWFKKSSIHPKAENLGTYGRTIQEA
jgi:hypothetical protein